MLTVYSAGPTQVALGAVGESVAVGIGQERARADAHLEAVVEAVVIGIGVQGVGAVDRRLIAIT